MGQTSPKVCLVLLPHPRGGGVDGQGLQQSPSGPLLLYWCQLGGHDTCCQGVYQDEGVGGDLIPGGGGQWGSLKSTWAGRNRGI